MNININFKNKIESIITIKGIKQSYLVEKGCILTYNSGLEFFIVGNQEQREMSARSLACMSSVSFLHS